MDLFAEYQDEARPTPEQVRELPPSLTGLGLDQPLAVIVEAAASMDRKALDAALRGFCRQNPGEGDHRCGCAVMDTDEDPGEWGNGRRADAHVKAEDMASERLVAAWALQHHGPEMPFNGIAVGQYLKRFSAYDT